MRRSVTALLLFLCLVGSSPTVEAFDWAGKIQQDLGDLRSPSARVRRKAVQRLGTYSSSEVKRHLLKALKDVDFTVQRAAAKIAAERGYREAVPVVTRWLSSWEEQMRLTAAEVIGQLGDKRVIKTLVRALNDPEHNVRLKIVGALGLLGHREAVVPLLGRLGDSNTKVRTATVTVLAGLGDKRAVLPLISRLGDTARPVRLAAVKALATLGDRRAALAITRLLRDPSAEVVEATIETLGHLEHKDATEPLIDLLQTGPRQHRERAATALGQIGTPVALRALLRSLANPTLRPAIKRALVASKQRASAQIAAVVGDPRTPRPVAIAAVEIAREARLALVVPRLVEQLRLGRLPKSLLIDALGKIADPRAQRPLLELLEDPNQEVRWAALRALDRVLDERAAEPLLAGLAGRPLRRTQLLTIRYLGRLKARIAVKPLLHLLKGDDVTLARRAAAAIAQIGDPRAIPAMIELLGHKDRQLRQTAIIGLAHARQKGTASKLVEHCRHALGAPRLACIQALGSQLRGRTHPAAQRFLASVLRTNDHSAIFATIDALAAMRGQEVAKLLLDRLASLTPRFRRRVAESLGNYPKAIAYTQPSLIRLLGDTDIKINGAAAWALGKQLASRRSPQAMDALHRSMRRAGWSLRINATAALARSATSKQDKSLLRTLAGDRNPYVRANALLGLGRLGGEFDLAVDRLQNDRSPWVRLNALRALRRLRDHPRKAMTIEGKRFTNVDKLTRWIARSDPDPRVRNGSAAMLASARAGRDLRHNWIGLYLLDREGQVLRDSRMVLVMPSGLVKAGYSDGRGQAWEEGIEPGRCFVELPPPEAPTSWPPR